MRRVQTKLFLLICCFGTGTVAASAQPASGGGAASDQATAVGEVVVTATRRAESLQNVPLSITALTADTLERTAATNFFDYGSSVPNLSFGSTAEGTTSSRAIAIRGIADRGTTGFYIDETPIPESLDPRIVDIDRIEVLRGPQGTLYGARSMGGTVRLITTQPDVGAFEGRAHAALSGTEGADQPNYAVDGALNLPLVRDKVGLRLVGVDQYDAGYFERQIGTGMNARTISNVARSHVTGASAAALIKLGETLSVTPRVLFQETKLNGFPFADVPVHNGPTSDILEPDSLVQRRGFDVPELSRDRWFLATVDVRKTFGFGSLTSSTSYFRRRARDVEDETDFLASSGGFGLDPAIPASIEIRNDTRSVTQEIRFASDFREPFDIVAGLFYNDLRTVRAYPPNVVPGLDAAFDGAFGTDLVYQTRTPIHQVDYAAYGEASYKIFNKLKAIAGVRVFRVETTSQTTSDGIVVGGPTQVPRQTTKEDGAQPKFSLQYQVAPGDQVYATAAKGFRPGGVNGVVPTALGCAQDLAELGRTPQDAAFYASDSVWSYEAGAKTTWFDRRLTADVSAFRIDWDDIQQRVQLACGFGFRGNAGKARSQGVEFEATARPARNLTLNLGFGYTDATFLETASGTRFSKGDRIPEFPEYTLTAGIDYDRPLTSRVNATFHAGYRYVGDSTSSINANTDPVTGRLIPRIRPSYEIADLRCGLSMGRKELALFAKNLFDERASLGDALAVAAETPGRARVAINQPRTVGIEFRTRF